MYFSWIRILIYSVFLILFLCNYLLFFKFYTKLLVAKKSSILPNIYEGIIYGSLITLTQIFFHYFSSSFQPYLILMAPMLVLIRTWIVFIISNSIPLISHWYYHDFSPQFILFFSTIAILSSILYLIKFLIKNQKIIYILFFFLVWLTFSFFLLISKYYWKISINYNFTMKYTIPLLLMSFYIFGYYILKSFLTSANSLIEASVFEYKKYYRITTSKLAFKTFVDEHKVNQGILFVFTIKKIIDENNDSEVLKKLIPKILDTFFDTFENENSIFFKISKIEYGFVIPIKEKINYHNSINGNLLLERKNNDFLSSFQKKIDKMSINNNGKKINNIFRVGACIYGIQEYDFSQAISKALFAINSYLIATNNSISLFNPVYYEKYKTDIKLIKKLNHEIQAGYISTMFLPTYYKNHRKAKVYISYPISPTSINLSAEKIINFSKKIGMLHILTRFLAANSVKLFNKMDVNKNSEICIKYLPSILSSRNFPIEVFENIINSYGMKLKNIILNFNYNDLLTHKSSKQFIKILKLLRTKGMKIAISNIPWGQEINKKIFDFKCEYVFFNSNLYIKSPFLLEQKILDSINIIKKENIKIISEKVSNETKYDISKKYGIDIFSGTFLTNS